MSDTTENTSSDEEQFAEALTQLVEFKDYFTDEKKAAELIDWLQQETGVSKITARLAVKHIAPFVLARLESLGKGVSKKWMADLHGRLGQYSWYFNLTQMLLNVLKTRTEKGFGAVLDTCSQQELEQLMSNRPRWEALKDDHKGLAQLLMGQNKLREGQDQAREHLDTILRQLGVSLYLKRPDTLIASAQTDTADTLGSAAWLTYIRRQAELIGRESSLAQLDAFVHQDAGFSWWAVTGPGGIGKSRLALEWLCNYENTWEVGFLPESALKDLGSLKQWRPSAPTLIVIDYAARHGENIGDWIEHLTLHFSEAIPSGCDFPVRLLILEREATGLSWWEQMLPGTSSGIMRKQTLFRPDLLELAPLNRSEQQTALRSFLESFDNNEVRILSETLPDQDSSFWQSLHELSNNGRPLFIGMVAVAIANNGIHQLRQWRQQDLLAFVLDHETRIWRGLLQDSTKAEQDQVFELVAFCSVINGLDTEDDEEAVLEQLQAAGLIKDEESFYRHWPAVQMLVGRPNGLLQPDIFAEYFLLVRWRVVKNSFNGLIKKRLLAAWKLDSRNTGAFLARSAVDYPDEVSPNLWWQLLEHQLGDSEEITVWYDLAFDIVKTLSLHGRYQMAMQRWLQLLLQSDIPKIRGTALGQYGKQLLHIGSYDMALKYLNQSLAIRREIGDRYGEGVTLNNISQVFKAQADYTKALDYLEQSLVIRQEIGDKAGEGATRNNISLIFRVRGDYSRALDYLEQSLVIQQEIGDKQGEGRTLTNISQIYDSRGDHVAALDYLNQSLAIQQEIGDKQGEGTTINNIAAISHAQGNYVQAFGYLSQSLTIQQEIGDKQGEGTVLNNISQIYSVRGDYAMALDYLEQSLAIQQEIGDRAGEGSTLHNISQMYVAREDYTTALDYLEQSLTLRQEIGDKPGMCFTVFNIGHIHLKNKELDKAFAAWLEAYTAARLMQLRQVLEALEGLSKQLELPGGMEFWEKMAEQTQHT